MGSSDLEMNFPSFFQALEGGHQEGEHGGHDKAKFWRAVSIIGGVYLFFLTEKLLSLFTQYCTVNMIIAVSLFTTANRWPPLHVSRV